MYKAIVVNQVIWSRHVTVNLAQNPLISSSLRFGYQGGLTVLVFRGKGGLHGTIVAEFPSPSCRFCRLSAAWLEIRTSDRVHTGSCKATARGRGTLPVLWRALRCSLGHWPWELEDQKRQQRVPRFRSWAGSFLEEVEGLSNIDVIEKELDRKIDICKQFIICLFPFWDPWKIGKCPGKFPKNLTVFNLFPLQMVSIAHTVRTRSFQFPCHPLPHATLALLAPQNHLMTFKKNLIWLVVFVIADSRTKIIINQTAWSLTNQSYSFLIVQNHSYLFLIIYDNDYFAIASL